MLESRKAIEFYTLALENFNNPPVAGQLGSEEVKNKSNCEQKIRNYQMEISGLESAKQTRLGSLKKNEAYKPIKDEEYKPSWLSTVISFI